MLLMCLVKCPMRVPGEGADAGGFALSVMAEKKRENGLIEYEVSSCTMSS